MTDERIDDERLRAAVAAATGTDPAAVAVHETHVSQVLVAGDRAFKRKKPLVLPFLDYGSEERRHALCREEVRLNRRLAPEVYLGVRALVPTGDGGLALAEEGDPAAVEHVVEMRRFDEAATLAGRLVAGARLDEGQVRSVAVTLAGFHAAAPIAGEDAGGPVAVERRMLVNVHELLEVVGDPETLDRVLALERFLHAFLRGHRELLRARVRDGAIRDGHGDLRAEHVLLSGGTVQVVDCIEFDAALRESDVADDLAFLVMDLAANGAPEAADALVAAYRAAGGDPGPDALVAFYAAHRALIRAKVALVRAGQLADAGARAAAREESARLLGLAESLAWRARLPLTIVVCGPPASGKSFLARALATRSGLPQHGSDATRKRLAGLAATERAAADQYGTAANLRTYAELGRLAREAVHASGGAIVDATFRHADDRAAFAEAFAGAAPTVVVECRAPAAVLLGRAAVRERDPTSESDAGLDVVRRELGRWEPLDEVPAADHVVLRTDRPVVEALADLQALLDGRLGH